MVIPWGILAGEGELFFSPTGKSALCGLDEKKFVIAVATMAARISNEADSDGIPVVAVNRFAELEENGCAIYNRVWGNYAPPEFSEGFAVRITGEADFRFDREIRGTVTGISRLPVKAPIPENGIIMIIREMPSPDRLSIKLGSSLVLRIRISPSLQTAIGGGPRIVRKNEYSIELGRENFGPGHSFYIKNSRHPRSAVGLGPEGRYMYLVVVEGRSNESRGMNMPELARLLVSLGASEAMAFDGGRSVSMYIDGKEVVEGDRKMADALGVFAIEK